MRAKAEIASMLIFVFASLFAIFLALVMVQSEPSLKSKSSTYGIGYILVYIVVAILFSFLMIYLANRKKLHIFKFIYAFIVSYVIFYVMLMVSSLFIYNIYAIFVVSIAVSILYFYLLLFRNEWYITDSAGFFLVVGISSIWGFTFGVWAAVIFLVIFAVYDYIAVYKTKHMVSLARIAVDEEMPMLFVIPESGGFKMKNVTFENRGEGNVLMLGFGDIALPSILVVSSALFDVSRIFYFTLFPLVGALAGMSVLYFTHVNRPAPGLPYINTGTVAGFFLAFIIFKMIL